MCDTSENSTEGNETRSYEDSSLATDAIANDTDEDISKDDSDQQSVRDTSCDGTVVYDFAINGGKDDIPGSQKRVLVPVGDEGGTGSNNSKPVCRGEIGLSFLVNGIVEGGLLYVEGVIFGTIETRFLGSKGGSVRNKFLVVGRRSRRGHFVPSSVGFVESAQAMTPGPWLCTSMRVCFREVYERDADGLETLPSLARKLRKLCGV